MMNTVVALWISDDICFTLDPGVRIAFENVILFVWENFGLGPDPAFKYKHARLTIFVDACVALWVSDDFCFKLCPLYYSPVKRTGLFH